MPGPPKNTLRSGDPHAFDALYEELAPRVLGFALRLTDGERTEAEDLMQDTFLAAFARRDTFKGQSGILAWLLGIARRRHRDAARTPRPDTLPFSLDMKETLAGCPGPEADVTRSIVLQSALSRLPQPQRDALLLVTQQGLTYKEAAQILDAPVGTIKWRVHEAAQAMRHYLQEGEETDAATRPAAQPAPPVTTRKDAPTDNLACRQ